MNQEMDFAQFLAEFGDAGPFFIAIFFLVILPVGLIFSGLFKHWAAKTLRVYGSTWGKGIWATFLEMIFLLPISIVSNFIPDHIVTAWALWVIQLVLPWFIIMRVFGSSFGRSIGVWFLSWIYPILFFAILAGAFLLIGLATSS